ncbi:glutaredoxin family protein [Anaerobacillus alkaliphilus]|uniref:Glutaredoxin family protein n=1 Tax=Anaerobacillus alkaliphilus TaxID=1548597 RepID=A0A4V1LGI1_9BACI|nr:glutaredoxin family protein [Anaerobacillus alkaliphilus]RXJ01744.1 glutaredoxin family protein [Anaerobacillus alkaliphilus]
MKVTYYSKENCSLCDKGLLVLEQINKDFPLTIEVVDIYKDDDLLMKYQIMIPVVEIAGEEVDYGILSEAKIRDFLEKKS